MKKILDAVKAALADVAKLKSKTTAAAIAAFVVAVISPFGINVGTAGPVILAAVVTIGLVANTVEKMIEQVDPTPLPPYPPVH